MWRATLCSVQGGQVCVGVMGLWNCRRQNQPRIWATVFDRPRQPVPRTTLLLGSSAPVPGRPASNASKPGSQDQPPHQGCGRVIAHQEVRRRASWTGTQNWPHEAAGRGPPPALPKPHTTHLRPTGGTGHPHLHDGRDLLLLPPHLIFIHLPRVGKGRSSREGGGGRKRTSPRARSGRNRCAGNTTSSRVRPTNPDQRLPRESSREVLSSLPAPGETARDWTWGLPPSHVPSPGLGELQEQHRCQQKTRLKRSTLARESVLINGQSRGIFGPSSRNLFAALTRGQTCSRPLRSWWQVGTAGAGELAGPAGLKGRRHPWLPAGPEQRAPPCHPAPCSLEGPARCPQGGPGRA